MAKHKKYHLGIKGLIRNKKGQILLLLKSPERTVKYGHQPYWDIPGGRVKEGDSVEETLKREIAEETGIEKIENKGLFFAVVSNIEITKENCGLILFVYECVPQGKYEIKLDDENTEYRWFDKDGAAEQLKIKYPEEFVEKINELKCF